MGKQGPCAHCGVTTTPLWRNGPPDKAILCNACGSRWRTRGTLEGYMPLHAGGMGLGAGGSKKFKKARPPAPRYQPSTSPGLRRTSELRPGVGRIGPLHMLKRKQPGREGTQFYMSDDEDVGESSRGQLAGKSLGRLEMEGSPGEEWEPSDEEVEGFEDELLRGSRRAAGRPMGRSASTGMLLTCSTSVPTPNVPRKRSTPVHSRTVAPSSYAGPGTAFPLSLSPSPFPLRRMGQFGCESDGAEEFDEEDLMVHNVSPMVSTELGLGSLMVRTPSWDTLDSFGNFFSYREERKAMHRVPSVSSLRLGEQPKGGGEGVRRDRNREILERFPYSKRDVLHSPRSPLVHVQLEDVINCDNFYLLLSAEERVGLLQMLSPIDTAQGQSSVADLFQSPQFCSALLNFQSLLQRGMFDSPLGYPGLLCPASTWDEIADDSKQVLSLFQKACSPLFTNLVHSHWWMEWSSLRERVDLKRKLAEEEKKGMDLSPGSKFGDISFAMEVSMVKPMEALNTLTPGLSSPFMRGRMFASCETTAAAMASEMDKLVTENCILNIGSTSRGGVEGIGGGEVGNIGEAARLFLDVPLVEASVIGEGAQGLVSTTE